MDMMKVGVDWGSQGGFKPFTSSPSGSQRATNAHGLFFDATFEGRLFSGGTAALVAINNATFTVATLGATATPILGLWNPADSNKNLSVLQATLGVVMTAAAVTGPGGFFWAVSRGNDSLTLGTQPFNRRTLAQSGSVGRTFTVGAALTGLDNNLVVVCGSALGGGSAFNATFTHTTVAMQTQQLSNTEFLEGSFFIPPGGVLALLCGTTPVAHSVNGSILFEELPLGASTL